MAYFNELDADLQTVRMAVANARVAVQQLRTDTTAHVAAVDAYVQKQKAESQVHLTPDVVALLDRRLAESA